MAIDVYSPCPGGTGKKIKFCCPDLVGDLEKIDRMVDGEQYQAGLSYVQSLLAKAPERACLLAARLLLLDLTEQWDTVDEAAEEFLAKHPDNPIAWAEKAMATARREGGRAAMGPLQRALRASDTHFQPRVYEAMGRVAESLVVQGEPMSAAALLTVQAALSPDDPEPINLLVDLARAPDVPLLMKSERSLPEVPAGAPWESRYEEAIQPIAWGCWSLATERIEALLAESGDQPALWRALATLRAWLTDTDGCIEALRKYASLDVPLEGAVEAQTLAILLSEDPLGDKQDVLSVKYTVKNVEELQTALAISRQIPPAKADPMAFTEGDEPPPKGIYTICDRAPAESGDGPTLENTPRMLCQALLFGRQTDREARLELLGVRALDVQQVKELLGHVAGDLISEPVEEVIGKISRTRDMLLPSYRLPEETTAEQLQRFEDRLREEVLLNRWVELPLGLLDGKTPQEAAALEAYRVRLLAAILLIESWFQSSAEPVDLNPLRRKLGLPTLDAINPERVDVRSLPLVRMARVEAEKLKDESLVQAFRLASAHNARAAAKRFSETILHRPSMAGKDDQLEACAMLARLEGPTEQGLGYIERGRTAARSLKRSCAMWDLLEMSYRLVRAEGDRFMSLLQHVQAQHLNEPGISESLVRLLMRAGLIRPDGSPAVPPGPAEMEPAAVPPGAAEPGKLWTPESQRPSEERKIWVPGME